GRKRQPSATAFSPLLMIIIIYYGMFYFLEVPNMNVEAGVSLGSSTAENIDFDGWFFSINYNLQLGRF
ncbi:hypothetical protein, partial [Nostoc sp.]|uniref:hypothetical protein n=1 Tax=Nostoc sp. TaxID=1180 RepID=UPI002FFCA069